MSVEFFLGANSGTGFTSLYEGFSMGEGDFLYLIKGGPGCGKSSFMKKIAAEAESRGYFVEYILCSGDPDSLDGIYLPQLHTGLCDATDPHAAEPRYFAVDSYYVNLGRFCPRISSQELPQLFREYKAEYKTAYSYLAAAAELKRLGLPGLLEQKDIEYAQNRARSFAKRELRKRSPKAAAFMSRRFLRSLGSLGELMLEGTLSELCKRIYLVDSRYGLEQHYLREISAQAERLGLSRIVCPDPLCPELLDALIFPQLELGFVSPAWEGANSLSYRRIRLDGGISSERQRLFKAELSVRGRLCSSCLEAAGGYLARAKERHDALELLYRPHIDFAGLDAFTEEFIGKLFS